MSSGTPSDPYGASNIINSSIGTRAAQGGGDSQDGAVSPGLSPRQLELNRFWAFYRCANYEQRKIDWNGGSILDHTEHEVVATQGFVPAGFYEAPGTFPIKFRRPHAPYYLAKIVVDRFTGLLFSQRRSPAIKVPGDELTEAFLAALSKAGKLNAVMIHARTYGGAMGSTAIGFQLVNGRPQFEVHDPRWTTPDFEDRFTQTLNSLEKRYLYPDYLRDPETGGWIQGWFWYRRVIDKMSDTVWPRVPVQDDEPEPDWNAWKSSRVEHNLGICPVVWVQNVKIDDDVDGDPDCHGVFDTIEQYDALMSQAQRGVIANCDPTLVMSTDSELPGISKGSDNAIKVEKGGSANYLEIAGSGPSAARELAKELRDRAFEVAACVPEPTTQGTQMTATEVVTRLGRMIERADILRDQYGEAQIRLLEIALHVCRMSMGKRIVREQRPDGTVMPTIVVGQIKLPPRIVDGKAVPHVLGPSDYIELAWPPYFEPTLDDISKATTAVSTALTSGSIDRATAANFLKNYLPITDVEAMLTKIEAEQKEKAAQLENEMIAELKQAV